MRYWGIGVRVFDKVEESVGLFSNVGDEFSVGANGARNVGSSVEVDDDFAVERDGGAYGVYDDTGFGGGGGGGREERDDEGFFDLCRCALHLEHSHTIECLSALQYRLGNVGLGKSTKYA